MRTELNVALLVGCFRRVHALLLLTLALFGFISRAYGQQSNALGAISIRLEQRKGDSNSVVPQNKVFHNGDILRFRITSKTSGYLYVLDVGTSGETSMLFPGSSGPGSQNEIQAGQVRSVPVDGDGWFEVTGPAGYDVLYFLISANRLALAPETHKKENEGNPEPAPSPKVPGNLQPRCDDEIFKARGDCIDKSAGVTPLGPNAPVPRQLTPFSGMASRDIIVVEDEDGSTVKASNEGKLPLIYTVRLAHKP
jgi:hypothetical protein